MQIRNFTSSLKWNPFAFWIGYDGHKLVASLGGMGRSGCQFIWLAADGESCAQRLQVPIHVPGRCSNLPVMWGLQKSGSEMEPDDLRLYVIATVFTINVLWLGHLNKFCYSLLVGGSSLCIRSFDYFA